ncbi:MAG: reprolysin-like metallopeptidase [Rhodanobacteraceae bacterium]
MSKRLLTAAMLLLTAIVLSASAATSTTSSSATPTLFSVGGAPQSLAGGAQKLYPVAIDENQAFNAIFKGGMWLPNPDGGREYAKYDHHLIHDNGDWTWVGKVPTTHGDQSVVITFGKDAVFGLIPQASGYPLRVTTAHGRTLLLQTSGEMLGRSPTALSLRANQDFMIPPRRARGAALSSGVAVTAQSSAQQQTASPTIDVMVAYTAGFVSEYGNVSAALTRIDNLIDVTNQVYVDSQVNQQIRLVHTVQVNYPDNTSNTSALDDITGSDGTNPVPIPASLQAIAGLRTQYGADLVSVVRRFDNAADGGCGIGWLIGAGLQQIVPSQDNAFGYSEVSDGSDAGFYCLDSTFAHELGHNMGNAHDRAHADKDKNGNPTAGAYSYSFGYLGNGVDGFSTIMAYGSASDTPLDLFSNPNISICQNSPCGVADNSPSSADNVHSMNNTAALIAQFEPTKVVSTYIVHNDVNGDGKSDLFWYNQSNLMTYWLMNGPSRLSYQAFTVPSGYRPIGSGDFDGNGHADILWKAASGGLEMWLDDGQAFTPQYVRPYPNGWVLIGVGDENGDGKADLFWYNPSTGQVTCWLMNGATLLQYLSFSTSPGLQPLAVGDFDGNGSADILWKTPSGAMYIWLFNGTSFTYYNIGTYPSGWVLAGVGDEDGDGKTDLFWYNPTSGQITYWLMNGETRILFRAFVTSPGLQSLGTGDYNGDGHSDLLWKTSSGAMYMWLFNGTSYTYYGIGAYPAGWIPIP